MRSFVDEYVFPLSVIALFVLPSAAYWIVFVHHLLEASEPFYHNGAMTDTGQLFVHGGFLGLFLSSIIPSIVIFAPKPKSLPPWLCSLDARRAKATENAVRLAILEQVGHDHAGTPFVVAAYRELAWWSFPNLWRKTHWAVFLGQNLHPGITLSVFGPPPKKFAQSHVSTIQRFSQESHHATLQRFAKARTTAPDRPVRLVRPASA